MRKNILTITVFLAFTLTTFAQKSYYYPGMTSKTGGLSKFNHGKYTPSYKPTYEYLPPNLSQPNFARYGYTKGYFQNGKYRYFGSGYISYKEKEKLKAIDRRYSPRITRIKNEINMNNSVISSEIYQLYPKYLTIETALANKFRAEIELKMIETMREMDIKRLIR